MPFFSSFNWIETFSKDSFNDAVVIFNDTLLFYIDWFVPLYPIRSKYLPRMFKPHKNLITAKNKPILYLKNLCYMQITIFSLNSVSNTNNYLSWIIKRILLESKNHFPVHPSTFGISKYIRDLKQCSSILPQLIFLVLLLLTSKNQLLFIWLLHFCFQIIFKSFLFTR